MAATVYVGEMLVCFQITFEVPLSKPSIPHRYKKETNKKQGWSVCILHMLSSQGLEFILTMKNVEYGLFISLSTVFLSSQARMLN